MPNFFGLEEKDTIVLFDMDGTLTPARLPIQQEMIDALKKLSKKAYIGIVSGSPWQYIEEQMGETWLSPDGLDASRLIIMPCNGTQVYHSKDTSKEYQLSYGVSMRDHLETTRTTPDAYREITTNILELQLYSIRKYDHPVTGNFLSYRGSMVNWCMIGRDASHEERATFVKEERQRKIREHLRECLRVRLDASGLHSIDLTLGGSTSIDIFPVGWDKTHALNHTGNAQVWFVGDKCMPGGNDHALYSKLAPSGRAKQVDSPAETIDWIMSSVIPQVAK